MLSPSLFCIENPFISKNEKESSKNILCVDAHVLVYLHESRANRRVELLLEPRETYRNGE